MFRIVFVLMALGASSLVVPLNAAAAPAVAHQAAASFEPLAQAGGLAAKKTGKIAGKKAPKKANKKAGQKTSKKAGKGKNGKVAKHARKKGGKRHA